MSRFVYRNSNCCVLENRIANKVLKIKMLFHHFFIPTWKTLKANYTRFTIASEHFYFDRKVKIQLGVEPNSPAAELKVSLV